MSEIMNISFDDGWIERTINNDPNRVIRWNPSDTNFVDRFLAFLSYVETVEEKLSAIKGLKETELDNNGIPIGLSKEYEPGSLQKLGAEFGSKLDEAFGSPVSAAAFGAVNPISPTPSGGLIYENFLNALTPIIEDSFKGFEDARAKYTLGSQNRAARRAAGK